MLKRQTLLPGVAEATRDRQGREVVLHKSAMRHIVKGHPEMHDLELAIMTAIENASVRCKGRKGGRFVTGREVHFAENLGPGPWLAVVVAYEGSRGAVITAYADKRGPKDADRI